MEAQTRKRALTYSDFCAEYSLSMSFLYELLAAGKGPKVMRVGGKRLISVESAEAWQRQAEDEGIYFEAAS